jgi:hypothetical protein
MIRAVLAVMLLAGCETDIESLDAGQPQWSCRMYENCAGSAQVIERIVGASSESEAEVQLVDECEAMACPGALACHAICVLPDAGM